MVWEKVGKVHVCGPWSIARHGYGFVLRRNGTEIGKFPTIAAAKLAAVAAYDAGNT